MNEIQGAVFFLRDLLVNDPALYEYVQDRVFRNLIPLTSGLPAVVISLISSPDVNAIGADQRLFTRPLFTVKVITEGADDTIGDVIYDLVDKAIEGKSNLNTVEGVVVSGCFRESPFDFVEVNEDIRYNHIGGNYRVFVEKGI